MDAYSVLKFLHVAAAVIWVGGGFGMFALSLFAVRQRTTGEVLQLLDFMSPIHGVMLASALATLVFGLGMLGFGASIGDLWIIIGLAGFVATFLNGLLIMKPLGDKLGETAKREGMDSPNVARLTRSLLQCMKFDYVMLFLIIADMVLKPTPADTGLLATMAVVLVAGAFYFLGFGARGNVLKTA